MNSSFLFTVFSKPWKTPLPEMAATVKRLGFDGVELPVRPGFQVTPERIETGLPCAVRELREAGLSVSSVAVEPDERSIAACAEAGVPLIRVCLALEEGEGYLAAEARHRRNLDKLVPLLERHGVTLGVQNHCDRWICNAMGLRHLLGGYDRKQVAAVWDPAHTALNGEEPEMALDILWDHLALVNLKNAFWRRTNGPEAEEAAWRPHWTSARHGLASWSRVARELKRRDYRGALCLTAEYTREQEVERLAAADLAFARSLF